MDRITDPSGLTLIVEAEDHPLMAVHSNQRTKEFIRQASWTGIAGPKQKFRRQVGHGRQPLDGHRRHGWRFCNATTVDTSAKQPLESRCGRARLRRIYRAIR